MSAYPSSASDALSPPSPLGSTTTGDDGTYSLSLPKGVVKVGLKPFNQDATGVVTLREGSKLIARASYKARTGKAVTVSLKLAAKTLRSLKRHSLSVALTTTAQAGTQVVTKSVRARVRRG